MARSSSRGLTGTSLGGRILTRRSLRHAAGDTGREKSSAQREAEGLKLAGVTPAAWLRLHGAPADPSAESVLRALAHAHGQDELVERLLAATKTSAVSPKVPEAASGTG